MRMASLGSWSGAGRKSYASVAVQVKASTQAKPFGARLWRLAWRIVRFVRELDFSLVALVQLDLSRGVGFGSPSRFPKPRRELRAGLAVPFNPLLEVVVGLAAEPPEAKVGL